jgi:outer membrane protein assembly factor BamA
MQQLGYFKIGEEPDFGVRKDEKKIDMTIKGTETSRNEIQFGAGYSALDGVFGQFNFQTRNFLGRGEILGLAAQIGKVSSYYDLSYTVHWFMDKNQSVGASVFNRKVNYLNIDESRKGGSLVFGKGIDIFSSWSTMYQYEDVHANFPVQGAAVPPGQPIPPDKFTQVVGVTTSITPGYRLDAQRSVRPEQRLPALRKPSTRRHVVGRQHRLHQAADRRHAVLPPPFSAPHLPRDQRRSRVDQSVW